MAAPRLSIGGAMTPTYPASPFLPPTTVTYAAGSPAYVTAPATTLSFVPPVADYSYASPMAAPLEPPPAPARLTEGIPDPVAIETQKTAYAKGLDDQLRQGAAILNQQLKQQMDQLHALGDQQKKKYFVQVDHEIKSQELGLMQQFKEQLVLVQAAAAQQKRLLGQQATALLLEYNQKKAQEDLMLEEYMLAKANYDSQIRYGQEVSVLQQQQAASASAAMQQQALVEQHAAQAQMAIEEQRAQVAQQMAAQATLVKSAESTAATATAMYSGPVGAVTTQPTVSYTPAPMTTYAPTVYAPSSTVTTYMK